MSVLLLIWMVCLNGVLAISLVEMLSAVDYVGLVGMVLWLGRVWFGLLRAG